MIIVQVWYIVDNVNNVNVEVGCQEHVFPSDI